MRNIELERGISMKTKEELNALKCEVEALSKKLAELNEEELAQVTGGFMPVAPGVGTPFANIKGSDIIQEREERLRSGWLDQDSPKP